MTIKGKVDKNEIAFIGCPLCDRVLKVKKDKNGKPYFLCSDCGLQGFVRNAKGRERLKEIVRQNALQER